MSAGDRVWSIAVALGVAAVLGVVGWLLRPRLSPGPRLDEVIALADLKRFDEAEARLAAYLRAAPDDERAHYLGAELALERPEPGEADARRGLAYLERVKPSSRRAEAMVAMYRGRARGMLDDLDGAEAEWTRALDLDPTVPEAGWGLLDQYYLQWRTDDATRLALRLHAVEPDPRDRVRLLLEIVRQDLQRLSPRYVVQWFEPRHRHNPSDRNAAMALGRALVRDARIDEGLALLRQVVSDHPGDPEAWDALLTGLDEAGVDAETWSAGFDRLPRALAGTPRFAKHRARNAQDGLDWGAAAAGYREAMTAEPCEEKHPYRLARVLRIGGHADEASRIERALSTAKEARPELGELYARADANKALGEVPDVPLYRRMGSVLARMGRTAEALAWYQLALRAAPNDPESLAAVRSLARP